MNTEVTTMLDELEKIVKKMDVPDFRCRKVAWLSKNLSVKNANHPKYDEAMALVKSLAKQGVR